MPKTFMRSVTDALMPRGSAWTPASGGDFDNLLDGLTKNQQAAFDDLKSLAYIRDPYRCPTELLPDLEREFGILPNNTNPEKERRASLAAIRYKRPILAATPKLQRALNIAGLGQGGYGLVVTPNSSLLEGPAMTAHDFPSVYCAGSETAFCCYNPGYYTDPSMIISVSYTMTAHDFPSIYCAGNEVAFCCYNRGYYLISGDSYDETSEDFPLPKPYWPLVFFVGGKVTRDSDGRVIGVSTVSIPARRRQELHRLILRIKPAGTWAAILVQYT